MLPHTDTQTHRKENTMDTNPYQLRFDILQMAKDLLTEEWHAKRTAQERQFEEEVRISDRKGSFEVVKHPEPLKTPSAERIIELASELNGFVSRKV